ncbi:MAG TPA: PhnD/SsuA/transferrin family substrate-binding protein [Acidithiobacillus sp.]|nr:PhnD/SsuA/transferrin family substrate-binding protein [Acidithiobacillus sp.]
MTTFEIITQSSADDPAIYRLRGVIDAAAKAHMDPLLAINKPAILDFTEVSRVNSMGLAILLNILKQLHGNRLPIAVEGMNRMTAMLFKMTGLNQYLTNQPSTSSPPATNHAAAPEAAHVTLTTTSSMQNRPSPQPPSRNDHWRFSVSLQERAQLEGWYFLNTHLQKKWGHSIRLEHHFGALEQTNTAPSDSADIVFASPFAVCELIQMGFSPLLVPCANPEEAVVIRRKNDERTTFTQFSRPKVITDRMDSYAYLLGRLLMDESGYSSDNANYLFVGNDIKSVQMLLRNMGDIAILPRQTFYGLSSITQDQLKVMDESQTDFAYHALCLSSHRRLDATAIIDLFISLQDEIKGQEILSGLGIRGWREPASEEINMLTEVYKKYVGSG